MDVAHVILDYIRTLVWPATVLAVVLVFREPIARLVGEGKTSLKGPGFEVQAEAVTYALSQQLASAAKTLTKPHRQRRGVNAEERRAAGGSLEDLDPEDEAARRQAIEQLLADSAGWGWQMAVLGWTRPPTPHVIWDRDGRPRLTGVTPDAA